MQQIIDRLQSSHEERGQLLKQLAMWAKVQEQGIDPEQVESFTFDPTLLSIDELRRCRYKNRLQGSVGVGNNPYNFPIVTDENGQTVIRPLKYNVVKMKDGSRIILNPIVESPNV